MTPTPWYSTVIGLFAYALLFAVAVTWVGISLANWLNLRSRCSIALGAGAGFAAVFLGVLTIIASDWLPNFTGPYVALTIRLSALVSALCFVAFTYLYLRAKRKQVGC
jgi:hypothetical protein